MDNVKLAIEVGHSVLHNMSLGPGLNGFNLVLSLGLILQWDLCISGHMVLFILIHVCCQNACTGTRQLST